VEVPTLEEIDVLLQRRPKEQWIDWMIASGSFFPMMQAKKIGENFYIDGGYRNNIPVDFVYSLGANYIVEVDVQGPGMKKRVSLPERVGHLSIVSPWTLGNILIFDGKRSTQNIQLGYLETKKIFEPVFGFWYSFDQENFEDELEKLFIEFTQFVKNRYDKHHFEYLNRFTRIYKKEVSNEELPLVLLEILGKFADISPFTAYSLFSFEQLLIKQMDESVEFEELHSLGEWFGKYFKELAALSDVQIFQKTRAWLRDNPAGVQRLWDILPEFTLLVLFYQFLEERHERISI
jgi:NTE family protein